MALGLFVLGGVMAILAHIAIGRAARRSAEALAGLVGDEKALKISPLLEEGGHPLVGGWGCVVIALQVGRVAGIGLLLASGLWVLLNGLGP